MANSKVSTAWRIAEAVAAVLGGVAILGVIGSRDDLISLKTWRNLASDWHDEADERLDYLERPELIIQIAQATKAVDQVEETAKIARQNRSSIALVQVEQEHAKQRDRQQEGYLLQVLDKLEVQPRPVKPSGDPAG